MTHEPAENHSATQQQALSSIRFTPSVHPRQPSHHLRHHLDFLSLFLPPAGAPCCFVPLAFAAAAAPPASSALFTPPSAVPSFLVACCCRGGGSGMGVCSRSAIFQTSACTRDTRERHSGANMQGGNARVTSARRDVQACACGSRRGCNVPT